MKQDFLLSITKNCETVTNQTITKAQGHWNLKWFNQKKTFHFNPPISIEGSWMVGLTDLEVYKSVFNITEEKIKFDFYKFPEDKIGGVSYIQS